MGDLDDALDRAKRGANPEWMALAYAAVAVVADTLPLLTTDDVWRALDAVPEVQTPEPRALGPVMIKAVRDGLIEPLTCSHCGTQKVVWRSGRSDRQQGDVTVYRKRRDDGPA